MKPLKMTRRTLRASLLGTLAGAALIFSPAAAYASDAPELYFYPTGSWKVGGSAFTEANAGAGGRSCAIRNEFNNGFIVQIDGSQKWVEALNVNFRQDVFETGQDYDVTLAVPGVVSKTLQAQASKTSMVTISLKGQKDFYQSLSRSAVFDMNIEGNAFRFYMIGFTEAARGFERCMAGGSIQPPAAPVEDMRQAGSGGTGFRTDATINESIAYEEEEARRTASVVEIDPEDPQPVVQAVPFTETVKLDGKPVSQRSSPRMSEKLAGDIADNPDIIAMDEPEPQPLQDRPGAMLPPPVERAEIEVEEITDITAPVENNKEPIALLDEDAPETAELSAQELGMARAREAREDAREAAREKARRAAQAEAEAAAARMAEAAEATPPAQPEAPPEMEDAPETQTEAAEEETAPKPEPVRTRMASPPMKIHREKITAEADFTGLDDVEPASARSYTPDPELAKKIAELERMVGRLENENSALNNELETALREGEQERMSISSENWDLERATMRFNEAERQIKRLGQQLTQERAHCTMEKKELETMLFDPQVTSQQQLATLADLESKLAKAQEQLNAQRLRYEERIRILEGQL